MNRVKKPHLIGAVAALIGLAGIALGIMSIDDDRGSSSLALPPPQAFASAPSRLAAGVSAASAADVSDAGTLPEPSQKALGSLDAAIREGKQAGNYRQFIHQVLAQPSPAGIRVGFELASLCGLIAQMQTANAPPKSQLHASLEVELQRRKKACEASGGIDLQQMRALSASKKRHFDSDEAFLAARPLKGTESELAIFHRLGDVGGMASWGLRAESNNLSLFAGGEQLLAVHADGAASAAWQAVVCQRFGCDDFNARMVRCRDDASCQMSLQDILKESSGVDDATWQQLLAAARRRLDALLPG